MFRIGMDAARLSALPTQQRLAALKRIIPAKKVTAALRLSGRGKSFCPRACDRFMLWFTIAMGLFCADCYRQIYRWLLPWTPGGVPGRSTLCEARKRLGVAPLVCLVKGVVQLLARPGTSGAFYCGLRLMAIDGFKLDLPDTPENHRVFGRPRNGRSPGGYPQAQVLALVELGTHVFWRWLIKGCHVGETCMTGPLLKGLLADMLLLWDRGFASFQLVGQVVNQKAQLLARWKNNRILRPVKKLRDGSFLAYLYADDSDRKANRNGILVRIIEYTLEESARSGHGQKHRLLTTLLDAKLHPAKRLVELYHMRWEEELSIDELKTHAMERPVLRSQTPAGVVQEIYGLLLGHYVVRTLMFEAADSKGISPLLISFTGTLKILRCRLPECPESPKARVLWWELLVGEVAEETIPARRNRINPRVIKKPQSKWPKKRACHRQMPQPLRPFRDSIKLLR
jgi:Transposase DDE domain/Insertion element 4 transposase N-terminal